jgi:hypothetical protein
MKDSLAFYNLIFALISGHSYGDCVPEIKSKDIWDYEPGVRLFGTIFLGFFPPPDPVQNLDERS